MKDTMKTILIVIYGVIGGCYLVNNLGHVILALLDSVSVTFGRVGIGIMTSTHYEIIGWHWLGYKMLPVALVVLVCVGSLVLIDVIGELIHD